MKSRFIDNRLHGTHFNRKAISNSAGNYRELRDPTHGFFRRSTFAGRAKLFLRTTCLPPPKLLRNASTRRSSLTWGPERPNVQGCRIMLTWHRATEPRCDAYTVTSIIQVCTVYYQTQQWGAIKCAAQEQKR